MPAAPGDPPSLADQARFEIIMKHGHQDLVQAVAFNAYGDRCATGSVDGKIRLFNRHRDGMWRLCDSWAAHGGEILELQWLPPTIYPNLIASMGIEGRFKLWARDPVGAAASGSASGSSSSSGAGPRFLSQRTQGYAKAAFETRSPKAPYRSFSMKHNDDTRHTHLALLAADGTLTVLENDVPENLAEFSPVDAFSVCARPARGEEASFRVRFDPNPEPCFTALRAGVRADALSLVVAAMDTVIVYRTRPITTTSYGLQGMGRAFYRAAVIEGHGGLVRDVAWAPGNYRGYDILATACQDGYVRVVRLDTPSSSTRNGNDGKSWAAHDVNPKTGGGGGGVGGLPPGGNSRRGKLAGGISAAAAAQLSGGGGSGGGGGSHTPAGASALSTPGSIASSQSSAVRDGADTIGGQDDMGDTSSMPSSAMTSFSGQAPGPGLGPDYGPDGDRHRTGAAGEIPHTVRELSRLSSNQTPVWRVAFDDDGHILGSVGDDGKLVCYRQTPDGAWARSSELSVMKMRMAVP